MGRPKKNESQFPTGDMGATEASTIKLRDQREYLILEKNTLGWLVAELEPDFSRFGQVFFWRNETISDLRKKNKILKES